MVVRALLGERPGVRARRRGRHADARRLPAAGRALRGRRGADRGAAGPPPLPRPGAGAAAVERSSSSIAYLLYAAARAGAGPDRAQPAARSWSCRSGTTLGVAVLALSLLVPLRRVRAAAASDAGLPAGRRRAGPRAGRRAGSPGSPRSRSRSSWPCGWPPAGGGLGGRAHASPRRCSCCRGRCSRSRSRRAPSRRCRRRPSTATTRRTPARSPAPSARCCWPWPASAAVLAVAAPRRSRELLVQGAPGRRPQRRPGGGVRRLRAGPGRLRAARAAHPGLLRPRARRARPPPPRSPPGSPSRSPTSSLVAALPDVDRVVLLGAGNTRRRDRRRARAGRGAARGGAARRRPVGVQRVLAGAASALAVGALTALALPDGGPAPCSRRPPSARPPPPASWRAPAARPGRAAGAAACLSACCWSSPRAPAASAGTSRRSPPGCAAPATRSRSRRPRPPRAASTCPATSRSTSARGPRRLRDLRALRRPAPPGPRTPTSCTPTACAPGPWPCSPAGPVVVTLHNAVAGRAAAVLERLVARRAAVVLAASADLAERARALGAPRRPRGAGRRTAGAAGPAATRGSGTRSCSPSAGSTRRRATTRCSPRCRRSATRSWPSPGTGRSSDELRARAPQVRWLGRRDDVGDLLDAADVVVLPSVWEARSLTAQEALRAGRPLVATAVGGTPDLVRDGAVLVPPGDPSALGAAVRRLLDDPDEAARVAARGRAVAATWPTEQDTVGAGAGRLRGAAPVTAARPALLVLADWCCLPWPRAGSRAAGARRRGGRRDRPALVRRRRPHTPVLRALAADGAVGVLSVKAVPAVTCRRRRLADPRCRHAGAGLPGAGRTTAARTVPLADLERAGPRATPAPSTARGSAPCATPSGRAPSRTARAPGWRSACRRCAAVAGAAGAATPGLRLVDLGAAAGRAGAGRPPAGRPAARRAGCATCPATTDVARRRRRRAGPGRHGRPGGRGRRRSVVRARRAALGEHAAGAVRPAGRRGAHRAGAARRAGAGRHGRPAVAGPRAGAVGRRARRAVRARGHRPRGDRAVLRRRWSRACWCCSSALRRRPDAPAGRRAERDGRGRRVVRRAARPLGALAGAARHPARASSRCCRSAPPCWSGPSAWSAGSSRACSWSTCWPARRCRWTRWRATRRWSPGASPGSATSPSASRHGGRARDGLRRGPPAAAAGRRGLVAVVGDGRGGRRWAAGGATSAGCWRWCPPSSCSGCGSPAPGSPRAASRSPPPAAAAVVTALALLDLARPAAERTHLGRFAADVRDGDRRRPARPQGDLGARPAARQPGHGRAAARRGRRGVAAPAPAAAAAAARSSASRGCGTGCRPSGCSRRSGFAVNDSGAAVPALALLVAVPATVAVVARDRPAATAP